jgi:hypothetical protein
MFRLIKKWLGWHGEDSSEDTNPVQRVPMARARVAPARPRNKATSSARPGARGAIDNRVSGKPPAARPQAPGIDAKLADQLRILDEENAGDEIEPGLDPYNTGRFDRSKNWDKRFRN